jgi:hypothetical protein
MEEHISYQAEPHVIQQLMFNRILSYVRLLSVDGVNVTGFDATTGTLVCSLAGVNVVVSVNPREAEPEDAKFLLARRLGG